jgi:hypothetical protein
MFVQCIYHLISHEIPTLPLASFPGVLGEGKNTWYYCLRMRVLILLRWGQIEWVEFLKLTSLITFMYAGENLQAWCSV